MIIRSGRMIAAIIALAWTTAACSGPGADLIVVDDSGDATVSPVVATEYDISPRILRRFALLEHDSQHRQPALVNLGRMLYYETRLSKTGDVSCNTCHLLDSYGVDGRVVSIGVGGQRGRRNSPSTYNTAGLFRQFWDGRADTLEEQVRGPLENRVESVSQIALNWLLQRPTVSTLIIGARNETQLRENLGAVGWSLTKDQIAKLDTASKVTLPYPYWHQRGTFSDRNPPPV